MRNSNKMRGILSALLPFMMLGAGTVSKSITPEIKDSEDENNKFYKTLSNEELKTLFFDSLDKHNTEALINFPNWKTIEVDGLRIVASNQKTATKKLNFLINSTGYKI